MYIYVNKFLNQTAGCGYGSTCSHLIDNFQHFVNYTPRLTHVKPCSYLVGRPDSELWTWLKRVVDLAQVSCGLGSNFSFN